MRSTHWPGSSTCPKLLIASVLKVHSVSQRVIATKHSCRASSAFVVSRLPSFPCVLLSLVLQFLLVIHLTWCSNFLVHDDGLTLANVLNKFVHFGNAIVIFVKTTDLSMEQIMLFVTHLKVLFETVDICAQ